jgi:acyl-CoA thioester hydrolase
VVYYANYLKFFERARTEYLRSLGFEQDLLREDFDVVFAVRSVRVDYLKPACFNDSLQVSASLTELKRASLRFNQKIVRTDDFSQILCQADIHIVCLTGSHFKPTPIPSLLLERIKNEL